MVLYKSTFRKIKVVTTFLINYGKSILFIFWEYLF
ncbi:hypothetical protein ES703_100860 [subsurface metagenome]